MRTVFIILSIITLAVAAQAGLLNYQNLDSTAGLIAEGDAVITTGGGGFIGEAASFDGTGDGFTVDGGYGADLDTAARTITAWVWMNSAASGENTVVALGHNAVGTKFDLQIDKDVDSIEGAISQGRSETSGVGFNTGQWEFVAISAGSGETAGDIIAYLNGGTPISSAANSRAINTGTTSFRVGRSAIGQTEGNWHGLIDEVGVWDEQLTDDEIECLFDVGNELGYTTSEFDALKQIHDAGSGSTTIDGTQWEYATGLGQAAGLIGSSVLILDASARTGVAAAGFITSFSGAMPAVNGGGPAYNGTETPLPGWAYMFCWHTDIGNSAAYVNLEPCTVGSPNIGSAPNPMYVRDGGYAFNSASQGNAQYMRLSAGSVHPGVTGKDLQPIAAYTIQAGDGGEGHYGITNSSLAKQSSSGDGVDLRVYVGDTLVRSILAFNSTTATNFDGTLGVLNPGDTVYVAYGNGSLNDSDSDAGAIDFHIVYESGPRGTVISIR